MARRQRREHGGPGAGAAARVGNGLRAAPAARNGHQPPDRRCVGGCGRRCAHRHRPCPPGHQRQRQPLWPPGHPAVPRSIRAGLALARRWRIHRAPDPAGRCADVAGPGAEPVSGKPLFRFISSMAQLPPMMLARFTLIDYDREMALVAVFKERKAGPDGEITETERIVGVSRYITNPDHTSCEFALVVADDFAGKGLGSRLMLSIMDVAREKGLSDIEGLVLANNPDMLKLMRNLGFSIKPFADDPEFKMVSHTL